MTKKIDESKRDYAFGRKISNAEKKFIGGWVPPEVKEAFDKAVKKSKATSSNAVVLALARGFCKAQGVAIESPLSSPEKAA